MLAAALLMSTHGHHHEIKEHIVYTCQPSANLHKKEKPLRGNALSFALKSFINYTEQSKWERICVDATVGSFIVPCNLFNFTCTIFKGHTMKALIVTQFIFFFSAATIAQTPLLKQWDKRFGGTGGDALSSFQQTIDGGYILGGVTLSDSSGDVTQSHQWLGDFWIIKIDSSGDKQWDRRFGGNRSDDLRSLQQTVDGGYILGGQTYSDSSGDVTQPQRGNTDYWVVKIDSLGNKEWDRRFGGTEVDELMCLKQTLDGGYILGGGSGSDAGGDKTQNSWGSVDCWVVKIDALGNKQWDRRFGGLNFEYLYSLDLAADGGYILGAETYSGIGGDKTEDLWGFQDYWIIKIDSLGNKEWDKDFGGNSTEQFKSLIQTKDGGFILSGVSTSGISGNKTQANWDTTLQSFDYWIVKIDALGNKQWDKRFGGTFYDDRIGNISQTQDKGYLIAGRSFSRMGGDKSENNPNLGETQIWIVKIDSLGNKQWDKTIFTMANEDNSYAFQTKDGGYAVAASTLAGIGYDKTQAWKFR